MKLDLGYYISIFWRRSPIFITVAALFTSLGLTLAFILPSEYEAQAVMFVESEQIPKNLAASTVQTIATEQIQIIQQRMRTREVLLDIANRLGVYDKQRAEGNIISAADIVEDMRSRITIKSTSGKAKATILTIGYRSTASRLAAQVANELVTLVLQENVAMRTELAGDTLEFFAQERDRLGGDLDAQSAEVLRFQAENSGSLPQDLPVLQARRATLKNDRATREREIQSLRDQREQIVDIFNRTGNIQAVSANKIPEQLALEAAEQQLSDARLIFSEQNPKLRVLVAKVEQLQQRLTAALDAAANVSSGTASTQVSNAQSLFEAQLTQIDSEIAFRIEEIARIDSELVEIEARLAKVPSNSITLDKLQRDYANIQGQYNTTVNRMSAAATGERIELLSKGQRISVIEQATPPDRPTTPNRVLISAAGAGVGMAAGFGLIILLELLNTSIRRPAQLTDKLGITPFAVLPYLKTDREIFAKRMILFSIVAFFVIIVPLLLFAVHSLYFPLDQLIEPFANRLGFSVDF